MADKVEPKELFALRRQVLQAIPIGVEYRHKKSGRLYIVSGISINESDLKPVVQYYDEGAQYIIPWSRPADEFREKFERK